MKKLLPVILLFISFASLGQSDLITNKGVKTNIDTGTAITGLATLYTLGMTNVRKYGAVGDGTTDDQTAITNAIAATPVGGILYFPEGTYFVGTTVSVNKAITIQGTGQCRVKVTGNISAFTLNSNSVNIDFINFHGSGKAGANTLQKGINCNNFYDFAITNCQFDSLNGAGIYFKNTNVGSNRYGGRINNCLTNLNNIGIQSDTSGEYVTIMGGVAKFNTTAFILRGGSLVLNGVDIHDNGIGVQVVGGVNNGHSTVSACKINHNSTYNIQISDDTLGFIFSGCQIFDSYIYLKNTRGVTFAGSEIAPIATYFENSTGTRFSNNVFYTGYGFTSNNNYNSTTSETFYNNNQYLGGVASGVFTGQDTTRIAVNLVDVLGSKNSSIVSSIKNSLSGTTASSQFQTINNSGGTLAMQSISDGYTSSGFTVASSGRIVTTSGLTGGLYLGTGTTAPIVFGPNTTESARFHTNGHLLINTTTDIAASTLVVNGDVNSTSVTAPTINGGTSSGGNLTLQSTTNATKGTIQSGNMNIVGTTLSGSSTTSNFLNVTGTLPSTLSNTVEGINVQITSAGSSAQQVIGMNSALLAGYTGGAQTIGLNIGNSAAGTDASYLTGSYRPGGNRGLAAFSIPTTTGINTGGFYWASNGNTNYGIWGTATVAKNSATNVAIAGFALNTGTSPTQIAGLFSLADYGTSAPTSLTSAAILADNGSTTSPIVMFRDNGTSVFEVQDGGKIVLAATNTAAGTTGAQTINKAAGTINIAAAGASVVLTNSLVTASSLVRAWVRTNDANKTYVYAAVPAAGSVTIYVTPAPAAEVSVGWEVIN